MTTLRILILGVMFLVFPATADAALLFLDPHESSYGLGDTFFMHVRIDNEDECINAVQATITYPADRLKAVDFSRGTSIINLWVEEPKIDVEKGTVTFAGGIPGGYCGRIQGDPAMSNVLGKIVFTVVDGSKQSAQLGISGASVHLNDGAGTKTTTETNGAMVALAPAPTLAQNPWLDEVQADTVSPDPFVIEVQSNRDVFGGRYYAVFATQDKQSGIDHFEIFERGAWMPTQSPHVLRDQSLESIKVRAIDKAGNERLGEYIAGSAPPRQYSGMDILPFVAVIAFAGLIFVVRSFRSRWPEETAGPEPLA